MQTGDEEMLFIQKSKRKAENANLPSISGGIHLLFDADAPQFFASLEAADRQLMI